MTPNSLFRVAAGVSAAGILMLSVHAQAGEILPQGPMTAIPAASQQIASFCGACSNSDHDACGGQSNGWSCCKSGCSDGKMQCHNVASCDQLAGFSNRSAFNLAMRLMLQPPAPVPSVVQVQSESCTNWYNNLQARISQYNSECSGTLSESQAAYCNSRAQQLNAESAQFNSQCG